VFITGRQVFLPVCNITADLQKAEQAIADSMLFRQEALLHQCKTRRIAQSTFGVRDGSALGASPFSPATAVPRAYLGTSPADGFTSVKAQVAFRLARNSDCPETKMNTASNQISI
jgi:hypothetical protein